jgi:hypothetical protein
MQGLISGLSTHTTKVDLSLRHEKRKRMKHKSVPMRDALPRSSSPLVFTVHVVFGGNPARLRDYDLRHMH